MSPAAPFFSIVIPAHDEEACIASTCEAIAARFAREAIVDYEICVVNDNSRDRTEDILRELAARIPFVRHVNNSPPNGFGYAVRKDDKELLEQVNASLKKLMAAPEWESLKKKYVEQKLITL